MDGGDGALSGTYGPPNGCSVTDANADAASATVTRKAAVPLRRWFRFIASTFGHFFNRGNGPNATLYPCYRDVAFDCANQFGLVFAIQSQAQGGTDG